MLKIFKYTVYDLNRNRWLIFYTGFFLLLTIALIFLSNDVSKVLISLSNITLMLTPLVGILYGVMYYYNSEDYIRFLLSQPISRTSIFSGIFGGMATSLSLSLIVGLGTPLLIRGVLFVPEFITFIIVLGMAVLLSIIFSSLAFIIALYNSNRIKGFGVAIFTWLFFAVIYDGLFLLLLLIFKDYPLENITLGLTMFNPIDLARILTLMNLDISAIMGYTGAVFKNFFGNPLGMMIILILLICWIVLPFYWMLRKVNRKDF